MKMPDKGKHTLLIDADLYAFSTAIALQSKNVFDPDGAPLYDAEQARMVIDSRMRAMQEMFNTHKIVMFFSCNRKDNWRRDLVKSYKMNREGKLSPVGLTGLMTYLKNNYDFIDEPRLEADDLLGIYATNGVYDHPIICSYDKDFLTIPTMIWNGNKKVLKKQSRVDALKFFLYQVMIGDSADGFPGIKGVGPKGAMKFLDLHSKTLVNVWEPLVELAIKKGHTEEYLLGQARMAFILHSTYYNFETKEIKLWKPSDIENML